MSKLSAFSSCWEALEPLESRLLLSGEPALDYHTLKFFMDPSLVAGMTTEELRNDLSQYAADLNLIFSKQTIHRFNFDPETGIIITEAKPNSDHYGGIGGPPTSGFEMWVRAVLEGGPIEFQGSPHGGIDDSGAGVAADMRWFKVYNPSKVYRASPDAFYYWQEIWDVAHEFEHVFGAGYGEYYNLAYVNDKTGVAPIVDVKKSATDFYWSQHPDFFCDPLFTEIWGYDFAGEPYSLPEVRQAAKFADVTVAVLNGPYRSRCEETVPDLSAVQVKVIDAQTGLPVEDASVCGWDLASGEFQPTVASAMRLTPGSQAGDFGFRWKQGLGTGAFNNFNNFKCLKAFAPGYAPGVQFVSVYEAQEQKLVYGRDTLTVTIKMEPLTANDTKPTIWSFAAENAYIKPQQNIELSADVVAGAGGTIAKVDFYYDADKDGQPDPSEKVGEDVTGADGWTWTSPAASYWTNGVSVPGFLATATDSEGRTSDAASLGVQVAKDLAPDGPPTLDPIADLCIRNDGQEKTLTLAGITDGGNGTQQVMVSATSDKPRLLDKTMVTYMGGTSAQLSILPAAGAAGTATITVTARDSGWDEILGNADDGITERKFTITVVADGASFPPTLDKIANCTIDENAATQIVPLTGITAGEGESQAIWITARSNNLLLVPGLTVTYTSPKTNGSLSYKPGVEASGTAVITVTVRDAGSNGVFGDQDDATFQRTFTVTVLPDENAPIEPPEHSDLAVVAAGSSVWQSAQAGTLVDWTATVSNKGRNAHTADWMLEWYLSPVRHWSTREGFQPILIGSQTYTDDLFAGGTISKRLTAPVPALAVSGQYYVIARLVEGDPNIRNNAKVASDADWFGSLPLSQPAGTMDTAVDLGTLAGVCQRLDQTLPQADGVYYKFTTLERGSKSNYVKIKFKNTQGDLALKLYDEHGIQLSAADTRHNSERLSLSGLPADVYYVQVSSAKGDISPDFDLIIKAPPRPRTAGFTAARSMPPLAIAGASLRKPASGASLPLHFGMLSVNWQDAFAESLNENSFLHPTLIDALNPGGTHAF